ncbi:alpha-galactosidase [Motilibacter peucedani]|uniref:Alpha-galactosidase n=1 Tax=Motilibacter peucedani TaxID=598650 RepID=A0A420XR73_9ACTN|nr:alpha-galactosidase [Motilibacter peucedani]RKS77403.1 alpha-galactosidase [Motilibacter peucedani]
MSSTIHLRASGTSLVIDASGPHSPGVVHWGADLGDLGEEELGSLLAAGAQPVVNGNQDTAVPLALLPEHTTGWRGRPGLLGSRPDGSDWAPVFTFESAQVEGQRVRLRSVSERSGLGLVSELELEPSGVLRARHVLENRAATAYAVESLVVALPVPVRAGELMDFTGRWIREKSPQRHAFPVGTWLREARQGRPGHDNVTVLMAVTPDLGFRRGEAWGVHLGWSGNSTVWAERTPLGLGVLAAGELLQPGELVLGQGETYATPWVYAVHSGAGLDGVSEAYHDYLRARPQHPSPTGRPRPVTLNVWEAVYFDHDLDRLTALADVAAELGVERFVLDDGWFRHRRDDTAGLGDWYVDETVWPQGLAPLADALQERGMEFGLWFEPEMVNPDSDLARAHPDWLLGASSGLPADTRNQQVLDLGQPAVWDYLLERIDAILSDVPIGYVKWDHNRMLVGASTIGGRAGVHRQTEAVYALFDELRRRHPGVEFESCASGGARVDLGILERTDRVWTSDCNDALERQSIQRWTAQLLPLELIGAHVGPTRSHTTDRTHDLSFRAATALFGHFGIEWDVTRASADERAELGRWIELYKRLRPLLHTGTVVRADSPDPALWLHGVVAKDRRTAVYAEVRMATSPLEWPGPQQLPGLDPDARYRVVVSTPEPRPRSTTNHLLAVEQEGGVVLTGRALATAGLQLPLTQPEHAVILEATAL